MIRTSTLYEFGDFALEVGPQRLRRRDTGEAIALTAKAFDTLVYLVESAGQTLDRDVLLRVLWPGVIVEENSLSQTISTLRQALGEAPGENRYILTIPRRGYRFVAKVTQIDESAAPAPAALPPAPLPARASARWGRRAWIGGVLTILI